MSHNTLLVFEVTILVLAIFLGIEVIAKVPSMLHTPLMSGTNAIHGVVVVGAMLVLGLPDKGTFTWIVGFVAVVLAAANVVGGFVVTDRMLEMFKKRERQDDGGLQRLESSLPDHDRTLHPGAAVPLGPGARPARQPDRRGRDAAGDRRHVDQDRDDELVGDRARDGHRRRLRGRRGAQGEDDRDAADGRAVQRRRRRRGGADLPRGAAPDPSRSRLIRRSTSASRSSSPA